MIVDFVAAAAAAVAVAVAATRVAVAVDAALDVVVDICCCFSSLLLLLLKSVDIAIDFAFVTSGSTNLACWAIFAVVHGCLSIHCQNNDNNNDNE